MSSGNDVNGTLPNLWLAFITEGLAPVTTGGNWLTGVDPKLISGKRALSKGFLILELSHYFLLYCA